MHFFGFAFIVCDNSNQMLVSLTANCISLLFVVIRVKSSAYAFLNVCTVGEDLNSYPKHSLGRRKSRRSWKMQVNSMVDSMQPWNKPMSNKKKPVDQLLVMIIAQSFS